MFGVTALVSIYLVFWGPASKYLAVYNDKMTIEYDMDSKDGYSWSYESTNDNVKLTSDEDDAKLYNSRKLEKNISKYNIEYVSREENDEY